MKKLILAALMALSSLSATAYRIENGMYAGCKLYDPWTGPDKTKHMIAGAGVGAAVTYATKEPLYGVGATILVAGAKEAWDRRGNGTCSVQDFAVTVAAGVASSYGVKWLLLPSKNGLVVAYSTKF